MSDKEYTIPADLPEVRASGLLFIADPHFAATPPGQRLDGFTEQVMDKFRACLEHARDNDLAVVVLGDLFHWPRDNPNHLLVDLIEVLRDFPTPCKPWILVGNHDKYQARYTQDVSLAVLHAAGVCSLMTEAGPQFRLLAPDPDDAENSERRILVGASPDMTPIPKAFDPQGHDEVLWCTHHNIGFPDFRMQPVKPHPIPGIDWIINGHIHRPQPTQVRENTRWANPGGMTRMAFSPFAKKRQPVAAIYRPGQTERGDLDAFEIPILPFDDVFPDKPFPSGDDDPMVRHSRFLQGLETLSWRKTREGVALKDFLTNNLDPDEPVTTLIWDLYHEAVDHDA